MEINGPKLLIFCVMVLLPNVILSQYFDNKIDLNISYNYALPIGSKYFLNDLTPIQYNEFYLFTSQKHLYGFSISFYYNVQQQSFGFEYASNTFNSIGQNEQYTKYNETSLAINTYRLAFSTEVFKQKKILNFNTKLKLYFKPQVSSITYENKAETYTISNITGFNNSTAPTIIQLSNDIFRERILAPGVSTSAKLISKIKQGIAVFIEYDLDLLLVSSDGYSDNLFYSNSLRCGFTLCLFKEKRYYNN